MPSEVETALEVCPIEKKFRDSSTSLGMTEG
jgi:hypothetical protein